ncbi:MAG: prepilin-type N-terminal cleavage/methylation domain-containing protein [Verrucomicrobiaceae bacterium]|nr:MAG: prepilin-type N-terminal cleavage/methylation domain-containing protein [Verrucomicrobiaceae bacterium]
MSLRRQSKPDGFTLVELLVVVVIIAVLSAILLPVVAGMRQRANMSREIAAARQVMAAYLLYPSDHDGELMPGFGPFPAKDDQGKEVHSPVNFRYPWRLAPYLRYDMRILWGNNADDRLSKLAQGPRDAYIYGVSVQPALGINAAYVGGDYQVLPPNKAKAIDRYGQFCVTRLSQAVKPQQLIVFASAGAEHEGQHLSGYFKVDAPNFTGRNWTVTDASEASPDSTGHVHFRYQGKAVAAMLDGHVELLDFDQMNDMRRWSNQAGQADNRQWKLGQSDEPSSSSSSEPIDTGGPIDAKPTNSN